MIDVQDVEDISASIDPVCRPSTSKNSRTDHPSGLAISDFWMAMNFMSSTAVNLTSLTHRLSDKHLKGFCSFNGYMTQLFVVQTDYWVLLIAICTFLILADYKHQSSFIQDHRKVLWLLPWLLSILWASIGLGVVGYGDIGAWCWFTSDRIRLQVNFIPRWIIILSILALYTRLYFLIHKAHSRFMFFDEESSRSNQLSTPSSHGMRDVGGPPVIELPDLSSKASATDDEREISADSNSNPSSGPTYLRMGRPSPRLKKISYQMMTYPIIYMVIGRFRRRYAFIRLRRGRRRRLGLRL